MDIFRTMMGAAFLTIRLASSAVACGPDTDCEIGDRYYRIAMPEGHDGKAPVGAIIFVHGYRGSAEGVMRNKGFRRTASQMGVALISVKSRGDAWSLPNSPSLSSAKGANELAYFDAVVEDATSRFALDRDKLMVTGFSAGGMMVWTLACERSDSFAAFAPMAGTFWAPIPKTCNGPVADVIHIHGDKDRTVPLTGRPVRETHQGDVFKTLDMYSGYGAFKTGQDRKIGELSCKQNANLRGNILNFCMYSGGHSFKSSYVRSAWEMFEEAGRL